MSKGNVSKLILTLSLPIIGSSLLQFTYNFVDILWIGGLGSDAVASIGSASFLIGLGYSINSLVVIGTSIKVSHSIGAKDSDGVYRYINSGNIINLVLAIIYCISLIVCGKGFLSFLNLNNPIVEANSYRYLVVSAPMMFFAFFNLLYSRILNCYGNNAEVLKINALGIVLNIILDPILIYMLDFGVVGAALGSLIANIVIFLVLIAKHKETFKYKSSIGFTKNSIIEIVKLGFPMSIQRILFTFVNIALAKIIASFGSDSIAAQKVGLQIESITFMIIGGLNGAISTFVGQNYGAKKYDRIIKGYNSSIIIGIIYSLLAAFVFLLFPNTLVEIFVRESSTVYIASNYLKIIAFSQIFSAIEMISNGLFSGIGKPKIPAIISVVFTILRIPLALLLIKPFGVNGIWISIALSSVLKGITAYIIYLFTYFKLVKTPHSS